MASSAGELEIPRAQRNLVKRKQQHGPQASSTSAALEQAVLATEKVGEATYWRRYCIGGSQSGLTGMSGSLVRVVDRGEDLFAAAHALADQLKMKPHTLALVAHDRAGPHRSTQSLVEGGGEECLCGADRIRRVDDHHIVLILVVFDKPGSVLVHERHARIVECGGGRLREELLAHLTHKRVNFAHRHVLHARMPAHLAENAAVAAADNEHALWLRMREEWDMCDHLLVCELVAFRDLNHPIQNEDVSIVAERKTSTDWKSERPSKSTSSTFSVMAWPGHITSFSANQPSLIMAFSLEFTSSRALTRSK
eukprot:CAMPEP_0119398320 /NCGR_PEP_ID=MMETSP1334-20130426/140785_1 /TAXON_ID=127549 /ORGANISM="Calcidiscus leptoporus, Strain RCC1130" /LENGTH=308 /DNA_ID=CAMNT_0007422181 /DNA_START=613 /DNA_END=1538 /DNA_ORIENTATION=+